MRVTNQIIYDNLIEYLQRNNDALFRPQQEIATGKKIILPSDDPQGNSQVVNLDAMGGKLNQYLTNQNVAQSFMEATNTVLDEASKILADIKNVALNAASGLSSQNQQYDSTLLAADLQSLLDVANTQYQGEYLFAGFKNDTSAYNNAGVYQGDGGQIGVQIAPGATIQRNLAGQDVFGTSAGGVDIFATIQALQTAITGNNLAGVQATISALDSARKQILNSQGILATRVTNLQTTRDYVKRLSETTTNLLSQTQSVDMNAVITELNQQMTSLQAVQAMASKVMNLSLVNFLK
ncbi:MAG: flagellar hook-associated protein FlgL [Nitrospirae bacterium]|nr:flagellar hook-associated protein FlgL [Nitrospirota bacterium]